MFAYPSPPHPGPPLCPRWLWRWLIISLRSKVEDKSSASPVDSYYYAKPEVPGKPRIGVPGALGVTQCPYVIEHKEHPHCPSSLHCLRDTDGRPPHTLPVILRCTILGSPNKKLTIREIYAAMENKYPWYKTAGNAWKVCAYTATIPNIDEIYSSSPLP
jgi:hypothetical protein